MYNRTVKNHFTSFLDAVSFIAAKDSSEQAPITALVQRE